MINSHPNFGFLVARIRKALRHEFEVRAATLDITAAQFQVLRRLWQGDGILTSMLTKDVCSDGGTITGVLDRLESKGLIQRERHAGDRRAVQILLTPEGRALETPVMDIIKAVNQQALAGFSAAEQKQLMEALQRVGENLEV